MAKKAKGTQSSHLYEISGTQIKRKNNSCPKMGNQRNGQKIRCFRNRGCERY